MGRPVDKLDGFFGPVPEALTRPFTLACLMAFFNAVVQPYVFAHDAKLYAVHLVARLQPGVLDGDLYLAYGCQDRYTLFSPLVGPLVSVLGLNAGFFLGYLISKFLLLWAMARLASVLIEDPTARVLGLLYLALAPVPFGGHHIFHVNEPFLTPRLLACALVLFGLERMLADRLALAAILIAAALLLHPLMAAAGILIFAGWLVYRFMGRRTLVGCGVIGTAAAAIVLADEPLGTGVFGRMDTAWRDAALASNSFVVPDQWPPADWWRIAWTFAVAVMAATRAPARRAVFLGIILAVGLIGLVTSEVSVHSPYRLLIQTSPYRAMWVLELLLIPLSLAGVVALWRQGTASARCFGLAWLLFLPANYHVLLSIPLLAIGILPLPIVYHRGLERQPKNPAWLERSACQIFVGAVGLMLIHDIAIALYCLTISFRPPKGEDLDPLMVLAGVSRLWYQLPMFMIFAHLARRATTTWPVGTLRAILLGGCVVYQVAIFFVSQMDIYGQQFVARHRQWEFVQSFLKDRGGPEHRTFTIYWQEDLAVIWFRAGARCYFNGNSQLSGTAFNQGTAVEGMRRLELARLFEIDRGLEYPAFLPPWERDYLGLNAETSPAPRPTAADLLRLCHDPVVDFVIVENRFDGLYCATDGDLYIYDCEKLRTRTTP